MQVAELLTPGKSELFDPHQNGDLDLGETSQGPVPSAGLFFA